MRRKLFVLFLIIATFILQTSVCPAIAFATITPNLLLILTASFGFMRGKKAGIQIGFLCGLLMDICFGPALGFYALLYMVIGYMNGYFCKVFFDDNIIVPMFVIGFSDLALGLLLFSSQYLLHIRVNLPVYMKNIILPETLYTMLISTVFYRGLYLINRWMTKNELEEQESPWLIK